MKKQLMVCLLGIGLLLPESKANSSGVKYFFNRIVDCNLQGYDLLVTSDTEDGSINKVEIYNSSTQQLEMTEYSSGYSCSVDVGDLEKGEYEAKVYCTYTTYTERFSK